MKKIMLIILILGLTTCSIIQSAISEETYGIDIENSLVISYNLKSYNPKPSVKYLFINEDSTPANIETDSLSAEWVLEYTYSINLSYQVLNENNGISSLEETIQINKIGEALPNFIRKHNQEIIDKNQDKDDIYFEYTDNLQKIIEEENKYNKFQEETAILERDLKIESFKLKEQAKEREKQLRLELGNKFSIYAAETNENKAGCAIIIKTEEDTLFQNITNCYAKFIASKENIKKLNITDNKYIAQYKKVELIQNLITFYKEVNSILKTN